MDTFRSVLDRMLVLEERLDRLETYLSLPSAPSPGGPRRQNTQQPPPLPVSLPQEADPQASWFRRFFRRLWVPSWHVGRCFGLLRGARQASTR